MKLYNKIIITILFLSGVIFASIFTSNIYNKPVTITILHTNDVHSRIEPFPESNKRLADQGGFARRATVINKIRSEKKARFIIRFGRFFSRYALFQFL